VDTGFFHVPQRSLCRIARRDIPAMLVSRISSSRACSLSRNILGRATRRIRSGGEDRCSEDRARLLPFRHEARSDTT
jgi:hypothetical protein